MKRVLLLAALLVTACADPTPERVRDYIRTSWERTVRVNPEDDGTLIGLPCPYTVPSPEGMFQEMYYWDTYFTNEGLLADGLTELAKGNTTNLLALVDRYGFVPNGSRTWYLSRSQPPFLSLMVASVFHHTRDTFWLQGAYETLRKEYDFWMTRRMTPCGLNRYSGQDAPQWLIDEFVVTGGQRLAAEFTWEDQQEHDALGRHFTAEAESGWDFNPRFDRRCEDFCPVDLNALLYAFEGNMAEFSRTLGLDPGPWEEAAQARKARMDALLWDGACYYDYDWVKGRRSDVLSAAIFTPLFTGMASQGQADGVADALGRLEFPYGLAVCEDKPYPYAYQWSYPNTWPPTTFMAVFGLDRYGHKEQARRLARKYIDLVCRSFKMTGKIWEKYDAVQGFSSPGEEYQTPEMLGWSAATYSCLYDYIHSL